MKCYYRSKSFDEKGTPVRGYRRRMHRYWQEGGLFRVTEQRLCDQARAIRKTDWLSDVELEQIRREVVDERQELEEGQQTSEEQSNDTRVDRVSEESLSDTETDDKGVRGEEITQGDCPDGDEEISGSKKY